MGYQIIFEDLNEIELFGYQTIFEVVNEIEALG